MSDPINFSVNPTPASILFKTCSKNCQTAIFKMSRGGATTNIDEVETVSVTETVGDIVNVQINSIYCIVIKCLNVGHCFD